MSEIWLSKYYAKNKISDTYTTIVNNEISLIALG